MGSSEPGRRPPNRVELTRTAATQLSALPAKVQRQIGAAIDGLGFDAHPPGSRKLEGADRFFRIAFGSYRVICTIDARGTITVTVVRIAHRKDVYRNL